MNNPHLYPPKWRHYSPKPKFFPSPNFLQPREGFLCPTCLCLLPKTRLHLPKRGDSCTLCCQVGLCPPKQGASYAQVRELKALKVGTSSTNPEPLSTWVRYMPSMELHLRVCSWITLPHPSDGLQQEHSSTLQIHWNTNWKTPTIYSFIFTHCSYWMFRHYCMETLIQTSPRSHALSPLGRTWGGDGCTGSILQDRPPEHIVISGSAFHLHWGANFIVFQIIIIFFNMLKLSREAANHFIQVLYGTLTFSWNSAFFLFVFLVRANGGQAWWSHDVGDGESILVCFCTYLCVF